MMQPLKEAQRVATARQFSEVPVASRKKCFKKKNSKSYWMAHIFLLQGEVHREGGWDDAIRIMLLLYYDDYYE